MNQVLFNSHLKISVIRAVAIAPKDSTFQVRINSEIKRAVEDIYAKTGMTLTDASNIFIQQSFEFIEKEEKLWNVQFVREK